jgi:DNA-binding transcriptional ArsR family regulator
VNPRIKFVASPVFELLAAMFRISTYDEHMKNEYEERSGELDELKKWIEEKSAQFSAEMKKDLALFFNYESIFGLSLIRFAWENDVYSDVYDFLKKLEALPSVQLFSYFLKTGFANEKFIDLNNFDETTDYIDQSNLPDVEKWKALYLFVHKEEAKQKILRLLKFFYHCAMYDLNDFLERQKKSIQYVKTFISEQGEDEFIKILSTKLLQPVEEMDDITLAPSVLYYEWVFSSGRDKHPFFMYGTQFFNFNRDSVPDKEQMIQAVKAVADEHRIAIIQLLSKEPLYGYELAQRLNLSSSTTSHHLATLSSFGFVHAVRRENKVYYEVQNAEIERFMKHLKDFLI